MCAKKIEMEEQAAARRHSATRFDVVVIGAGPTGLACAIEAGRRGLRSVLVDKGCLCNSLFHYPANMTFFTTPELLEIGDMPFPSPNQKPTRDEALEYYRKVADHYQLDVRQYETVLRIEGSDGEFRVRVEDRFGREQSYLAHKIVVATGYYDLPNYLKIPGEALPKVMHYYDAPHPYLRHGRDRHRRQELRRHRRARPVAARRTRYARASWPENASSCEVLDPARHRKPHQGRARWRPISIRASPPSVRTSWSSETPKGPKTLRNDFVFALTGYHPDFDLLTSFGVRMDDKDRCPECDPQTLESNVPGIYLAGVIVAGSRTNEIFIENGRFHGRQIAEDIAARMEEAASPAMREE